VPAQRQRLPPGAAALRPRARPRIRSRPCRMLRHRRTACRARTRPFECCSGRACRQSRRRKRAPDLGSAPPDSDRARCRGLHLHMEPHRRAVCSARLGTSRTGHRRSRRRRRPRTYLLRNVHPGRTRRTCRRRLRRTLDLHSSEGSGKFRNARTHRHSNPREYRKFKRPFPPPASPPARRLPAPLGLVTVEGGLMQNSPSLRRVIMPSRCIGAPSGVRTTMKVTIAQAV
jgi:hypothetical protein